MSLEDKIEESIKETKKGTGLAIIAIGISVILFTLPTMMKLFGFTEGQEAFTVILYFIIGFYLMVLGYSMRPKKNRGKLEEKQ